MNRREFLMGAAAVNAALMIGPLLGGASRAADREAPPPVFRGRKVLDRLMRTARLRRWADLPIGTRVGTIGMELRGTPYVASTLERPDGREACSVDLLGLDCVTFFEICLGVARILKHGDSTPEALLQ